MAETTQKMSRRWDNMVFDNIYASLNLSMKITNYKTFCLKPEIFSQNREFSNGIVTNVANHEGIKSVKITTK